MTYTTPKIREFDEERQRIMARIFDPSSTREQVQADRARLDALTDIVQATLAEEQDEEERTTLIGEIQARITPRRHKNDPHFTWEDRDQNGIVSRIWNTFTYLVFAQRIGAHLFSEPAGKAIKKMKD